MVFLRDVTYVIVIVEEQTHITRGVSRKGRKKKEGKGKTAHRRKEEGREDVVTRDVLWKKRKKKNKG